MSTIKALLKDFLGSPAFRRHLHLGQVRAEHLPLLHERVAAFAHGEVGVEAFRDAIAEAVEREANLDGEAIAVWGFGGPGTAQFIEVLCRVAAPQDLEAELRGALVGIDLRDPSERLRSFASFVAQVARSAGVGPESNLHVGYATCFLSFCWHVLYDLDVPVFYGTSHKGMKVLLASGAVDEPEYASRDLARRFGAFLRVTHGLRDLLRRVNPRLSFWTVEAFLDWYADHSDLRVEDSGAMPRPTGLARPTGDAMATMAMIDPSLVAAAIELHDGPRPGASPAASFAAPHASPERAPAWYEGRVHDADPDLDLTPPPPPVLDPSLLSDVPLRPAGSAGAFSARGRKPSSAPAGGAIPGLAEYGEGEGLFDSTSGARAPGADAPAEGAVAATDTDADLANNRRITDDDDDDDDDDADDADDDYLDPLEPALASSAFAAVPRSAPAAPAPAAAAPAPTSLALPAAAAVAGADGRERLLGRLEEATFWPRPLLEDIFTLLERRGQVALEGPFGCGKSHLARELADGLAGAPERVRVVPMHPGYRYEELIEAPIPGAPPGPHAATPGVLRAFAESARRSPDKRYVVVLDDIGRADAVRALGEVLSLLEHRGTEALLPYSRTSFSMPKNLLLIATAGVGVEDGGLSPALRRRFPCVRLRPDASVLRRFLERNAPGMAWVADLFEALNKKVRDDLGAKHEIGHAVLMREGLDEEQLARIWTYDVLPSIEAEAGGDPDRVRGYELEILREALAPASR